jgi:hypothetical protein
MPLMPAAAAVHLHHGGQQRRVGQPRRPHRARRLRGAGRRWYHITHDMMACDPCLDVTSGQVPGPFSPKAALNMALMSQQCQFLLAGGVQSRVLQRHADQLRALEPGRPGAISGPGSSAAVVPHALPCAAVRRGGSCHQNLRHRASQVGSPVIEQSQWHRTHRSIDIVSQPLELVDICVWLRGQRQCCDGTTLSAAPDDSADSTSN